MLLTCRRDVVGAQVNRRVTTIFAWTHSGCTQYGHHHSARDLNMKPKPGRPIPVSLGAFGPCALAVTAGLADGWIPPLGSMPTGEIPAVDPDAEP